MFLIAQDCLILHKSNKMREMKVSVLLPIYGVESYIAQCATSLMEQTYKDVEYIFVNDCTPDASMEQLKQVLESYPERNSNVQILEHEQNMGLAMARITALNAATGEAVIFVDSDDFVATTMVECLVAEIKSSSADIIDAGYAIVCNGAITKKCIPMHVNDKAYLKTILCQNVEPNRIWGRLIKKSLFEQNRILFTPGVNYGEDFSVLPRLLVNACRSWVDDCLYYYRDDNPQSYTNNITTKNAVSYMKSQQIVGEYFVKHPKCKDYVFAMQLGWVNIWRFARRFNVDKLIVEEHFNLKPTNLIIRFLSSVMKNEKIPYKLANFLYLSTRKIYLVLFGR